MKNSIKLPRILKIKSINGFIISCVFNNGETRTINFQELFKKWKLKKSDKEYLLTTPSEFKKVTLRNQTLSWPNIQTEIINRKGKVLLTPFELSPDLVFKNSKPIQNPEHRYFFGSIIRSIRVKEGITQEELAKMSGTSKTYISRVENDQVEPELSTLYKIIEIGLGKKISIKIK